MSGLPENALNRWTGEGSLRRVDVATEQPTILDLPMKYVGISPKVKVTAINDVRRGRRGIPIGAHTDGELPKGKLTIMATPTAIMAMLLLGTDSVLSKAEGSAVAEAHACVAGYGVQLNHDNIGTPTVYPGVRAALATGTTGAKNAVTYTARSPGTAGNDITIARVDAAVAATPLAVSVTGSAITITLANASGSAVTTTAAEELAAVAASSAAAALVSGALTAGAGNNGSGLVAAVAATHLTSGSNTGTPLVSGTDYNIADAREGQLRILPGGALGAINTPGNIWISYPYGAIAGRSIAVGTDTQIVVEARFSAQNDEADDSGVVGSARRLIAYRLLLTPAADINLAGVEAVEADFDAIPLAPLAGNAVELQAPVYAAVAS